MSNCTHSIRHGPLCALCGETIQPDNTLFCLLHDTDTLRTTPQEADKIARIRKKELDAKGKLILIIDLDHTLVHATLNWETNNSQIRIIELDEATENPKETMTYAVNGKRKVMETDSHKSVKLEEEDVLYSFYINGIRHLIRVRPHCRELLNFCCDKYEMHVYTMGIRSYANKVVKIIDPDGRYFENRIISRDENMDQDVKTLDRLSSDHRNIVVLDDRGDIWKFCSNLVMVKPFYFFKCGDINDPCKIKQSNAKITNENGIYPGANEDLNLKFVSFILKNIHTDYFNGVRNVRKVMKFLRENILKNKRFMVDSSVVFEKKSLKKIIKNSNGKLRKRKVDYIIASSLTQSALEMHKETRADIIDVKYLMNCYLYFQPYDFENNSIKKFVDDDLIKEFDDSTD